jgi:hypothetical protein
MMREWRLGGKLGEFCFGGKRMLLSSRVCKYRSWKPRWQDHTNVPKCALGRITVE